MRSLFAVLAFALAFGSGWATMDAQPGPAKGQAVQIEGAQFYDIRSALNGRDYRIFVYAPAGEAPAGGFPVIYVLDGNSHFYTAVSAARAQAMFGEIRPAIVVGIGYPLTNPLEILTTRNKDLTTAISSDALARMPPNPGLTTENTGGVDAFLDVIDREVKPFLASLYKVDHSDQSLFGHSLGGLAVVRALMTRPLAYRTFASASPSLFWNDRAVLADLNALIMQIERGDVTPRVLLMAGALEGSRVGYRTGLEQLTQRQVNSLIETTRMVDNPSDLGALLAQVHGHAGYRVETFIFDDESHLSVIPASIARALNFALSVDGDGLPARVPEPDSR